MKIGILTFHKSVNYGSVLQAWALQETLRSFGYDAEIIDYEPGSYKSTYGLYLHGKGLKIIKNNLLRIPVAKYRKSQLRYFREFRKNNLNLSKEQYAPYSDPRVLEKRYDIVVCGSDQIWNVHAKDCDDFYFLPKANVRKIAYAVSINNTDFTEERCNDEMRNWISDFCFLSCREESGSDRMRCFLGVNNEVYTVLDPTLLHDKRDYNGIISPRIIPENYVFLYKVWTGKDSYHMAKSLGDRLSLPVYSILPEKNIRSLYRIEKQGIKVIKRETRPEDYLSLINYASYVMTDSFHGTAFSIIFEKPFVCVREKRSDGSEKNDERIRGILNLLGLSERYVRRSELEDFDINKLIDYRAVTQIRRRKSDSDIRLLKMAIEEN